MRRRAHILLALVVSACGNERPPAETERARAEAEPVDCAKLMPPLGERPVVDPQEGIGDPDIQRVRCEPGPDAPTFRMVGIPSGRDPVLGSCGDLTWYDADTGAFVFAGVDEEPRQIDEVDHLLWTDGRRLLYGREGGVALDGSGGTTRSWAASGAAYAAPIPGADAFWTCSRDRGIERLDAEGVTGLTPDFITGLEFSSGCWSIDVSGGVIAYPTSDRRLGIVDAASGLRCVIDFPFQPHGTVDRHELHRADLVRLAPDASFVLHEKRWYEVAVGPVGEGRITLATGDSLWAHRFRGQLDNTLSALAWMSPWMGTAQGVLLPDWYGANLVGLGEPLAFGDLQPKTIRGNHLFAETRPGASLLDLTDGRLHHLLDAPDIEQIVPYRWGGPVAFSHLLRECISYPDRPDTCHTSLWAVTVWSEARGARRVATGVSRLSIEAVGPEGQLVVHGQLLDGPPPATAEPWTVDWRVSVLDAEGRIVRQLEPETRFEEGIGGAHFAVLERTNIVDFKRMGSELIRLDWATGDEEILVARPRAIVDWALDHSDTRVTALVLDEESGNTEIWTGVVGR